MGRWVHRLSEVDPETRRGICAYCGPTKLKRSGTKNGVPQWRCKIGWLEAQPDHNDRLNRFRPYRPQRGESCERIGCTTTIEDLCQLDVHHIDGNHQNNDPDNLMTVCSSCHRLATYRPILF